MNKSEQIGQLAAALATAQGAMAAARKDSQNPHFKSKYADLASVWDAVRGPLSAHGLAVVQTLTTAETGAVAVTTTLAHESGEWVSDTVSLMPAKMDAQGLGSVVTYLRRYSLSAIVGGYADDDDAETDRRAMEAKAAPPTLSVDQVVDILALAQEVGADVAKIAPFYRVDRLEDVPAAAFAGIIKSLEKKREVTR